MSVIALGRGDVPAQWMGGEAFGWPGVAERLRVAPWRAFGIPPALLRAARALTPYHEVFAHWLLPCGYPLGWYARRRGRCSRLEVWAHGADVRLLSRSPRAARHVLRALLGVEASFVFVSNALRDELCGSLDGVTAQALLAASRIEAAPIDVPPRSALSDPRTPPLAAYVLWVGRDTPDKRLDLALAAAARTGATLVVIGSARVGLGLLPRQETLRWIAHASALVVTSVAEGAPTVVREARALEVPVIAFPCGDLPERAQHDRGISLVETQADLERAMRSALGEHRDQEPGSEGNGAEEDQRHGKARTPLR